MFPITVTNIVPVKGIARKKRKVKLGKVFTPGIHRQIKDEMSQLLSQNIIMKGSYKYIF